MLTNNFKFFFLCHTAKSKYYKNFPSLNYLEICQKFTELYAQVSVLYSEKGFRRTKMHIKEFLVPLSMFQVDIFKFVMFLVGIA